jgi:carboxylesterase
VFVHGLLGRPEQFDDMVALVAAHGYASKAILLPGHGGSGWEFAKHGYKCWQSHLDRELARLRGQYGRTFLVTHSMGGLLALNASLVGENHVSGVFMLAAPMRLNYGPRSLYQHLKLLVMPKSNPIKQTYIASVGVTSTPMAAYPLWLRPVLELIKLMRLTKGNLPQVSVPVTLVHSVNDENVALTSADLLWNHLSNAPKKRLTLEHSWHAYYPPTERAIILKELLDALTSSPSTED